MPKFNDTTIYGDLTVTGSISGNIATTTVSGLMSTTDKSKLDSIEPGAQVNATPYYDYASIIYGDKYSLLANAWEHSLTVDPLEISEDSDSSSPRGTAEYPNGENEGVIIPHSVTSIGDYAFGGWASNNQPLVIPNTVTNIGSNAFSDWRANTHPLVIPDSVTSIGDFAFFVWIANNQPLVIPNSVTSIGDYAFFNWIANTHPLVIPNSITSIGQYAFGNWFANNQPLVIPDSVTSIGDFAFFIWIANNQPLVIPDSVTSIGDFAFRDWKANNQPLVIPNSVTSIGRDAFYNWTSNKHPLVIPESVTSIGELAFSKWTSVPYVEIQAIIPPTLTNANAFDDQNNAPIYVPDESVDAYKAATNWVPLADRIFSINDLTNKPEIGYMNYAADIFYRGKRQSLFANAWEHSLTVNPLEISANSSTSNNRGTAEYPNGETEGVIIPHSVTSIGDYAFSNWDSNNQPLVIPNSVTSIGSRAFNNWASNNQPLVIPNTVTNIGSNAFQNWTSNTHPLVIPDSVTSIGGSAFEYWNSNNQPLVIPNSVTSIGELAFQAWSANNQPLVIPNSVTIIGSNAFYNWTSNKHPLVIPESVTSIGELAFSNWTSVPYVEIQATTLPSLTNANAFDGQNDAPIYVPDESVDDYKTATNWVSLADRIFPISDLNMLGYMNYAADIFYRGKHQSLFANAWANHNKRTTLFDGNISFEATDDVMGEPLSFYNGVGVDELYDLLENGGVRPGEALKITINDTVYDDTMYFRGSLGSHNVSVGEDFPLFMAIDATVLGMPYGKAIGFPGNENVNYLKIETGFNHYYKNGIIIPEGVEIVPNRSYTGNTHVEVIDEYFKNNDFPLIIPNSVTSIGSYAFGNWRSNNQPLVIPDSVTSIGSYAFGNWRSNNQPLVIPDSVTSIGGSAFEYWNSNNQPLVIPNSVTSIGELAFQAWSANNQPLVIPDRITSIGSYAFRDWIANNQPLVIPDSITSIGSYAFYNWTSNKHPLVIPDSVTSIGEGAFSNWTSNNQPLVIPSSVTSIGGGAFLNWNSNNQPLVIPNSVTSIGGSAFNNWQSVPYVEIHATTPPTLTNANAFNGQNNALIYVPDESVDDYKTATAKNWVDLADRIFPISDKGNTYTKEEIDLMIGDIDTILDSILGV